MPPLATLAPAGKCRGCDCELSIYRVRVKKGQWDDLCGPCRRSLNLAIADRTRQRRGLYTDADDDVLRVSPGRQATQRVVDSLLSRPLSKPNKETEVGVRKFHTAVIQKLEPFGWEPAGIQRGSKHLLMRHSESGLTFDVPSSPRNEDNAIQMAVQRARRLVAQGKGEGRKFVDWLLDSEKVPIDGYKDVELRISDKAQEYIKDTGSRVKILNLQSAASGDERIETLQRAGRGGMTKYRLKGDLYEVAPLDEADDSPGKPAEAAEPKRETATATATKKGGRQPGTRPAEAIEREERLFKHLTEHGPTEVEKVREITGVHDNRRLAALLGLRIYKQKQYQGVSIYALPTHPAPPNTVLTSDFSKGAEQQEAATPEPPGTDPGIEVGGTTHDPERLDPGYVEPRSQTALPCNEANPRMKGVFCTLPKGHAGMHQQEGTRNTWPQAQQFGDEAARMRPRVVESVPTPPPTPPPAPAPEPSRVEELEQAVAAEAALNGPVGIGREEEAAALFRRLQVLLATPERNRAEDAETRLQLMTDELDTIEQQVDTFMAAGSMLKSRIADLRSLATAPSSDVPA